MLRQYLNAAWELAHYEMIEDGERYFGEIPGLVGLWATGSTREGCRHNLLEALEDWILFCDVSS